MLMKWSAVLINSAGDLLLVWFAKGKDIVVSFHLCCCYIAKTIHQRLTPIQPEEKFI
jgi:hypothetical protein